MQQTHNPRGKLTSVQNGLNILKLFSKDKPEWGITEMARALQLHKSMVSRLVKDLIAEDYLEKTNRKYRLGLSLLNLSGIISSRLDMHREAQEPLQSLVDKTDETAHISILEGSYITYLHKIESRHPVRLLSHIGKQNPATCTSSGKVLLAFQSKNLAHIIHSLDLPKMGPNSITDPADLERDLLEVREQGYSVCIDEMHEDVISIAAPIRNYTGEVRAAVSIVGPRHRIRTEQIPVMIREVMKTGDDISARLGYIPDD